MGFELKHNDDELFPRWLSWYQNGGTKGNRTTQAAADFLQVPFNTLNKRLPSWRTLAQAQAGQAEPLSNAQGQGSDSESRLKAASHQISSAAALRPVPEAPRVVQAQALGLPVSQAGLDDLEPLSVQDLARAELAALLKSPDPTVRARVALALSKQAGQDQDGQGSPYDGMPAAALLDRLLLLTQAPLRASYDAERGKAFLIGTLPHLPTGNTLDPDGRLAAGAAE